MPHLVAIDLPGGPAFVDALQRTWDDGDAAMPVDQRLPSPARAALLDEMRPNRIIHAAGMTTLPDGEDVAEGDALVVVTSGSTGAAKGVVLTHDAVRASALATSGRLEISGADRWLACLPLSHVGGLGVVTRALVTSTPLIVHDGFDADAVANAARDGATTVALVATALRRIEPALFRVILVGGSRPPADRPPNVVVTYGMTETGGGVVYDGRPLDGVEVRIDDSREVHVRGPMLMRAYRSSTVENPIDGDGWLATGDIGRWLDDGRLHVDGRRADLIISGGENIWPEQVEAVLATSPRVADVAVAGVEDPEWGQRVVAWVVPTAEQPPTIDELRAHVRLTLPAFMAPRELRLVTEIPRTALGKPARHSLS